MARDIEHEGHLLADGIYKDYLTVPILRIGLNVEGLRLELPEYDPQFWEDKFIAVATSPISNPIEQREQDIDFINNYLIEGKFVEIMHQNIFQGVAEVKRWEVNYQGGYTFFLEWTDESGNISERIIDQIIENNEDKVKKIRQKSQQGE